VGLQHELPMRDHAGEDSITGRIETPLLSQWEKYGPSESS
jgi:hypothetical protein